MNEVFGNDLNASRLTELVHSGCLVVVIGSGLSSQLYPRWHDLVTQLCEACQYNSGINLNEDTSVDVLTEFAEEAYLRDKVAFVRKLEQKFSKRIHVNMKEYQYLMNTNFDSYVTLNFDPLLADTINNKVYKKRQLIYYPCLPTTKFGQQNVFYIHGYIHPGSTPKPSDLILTKSTFHQAYSIDESELGDFWNALLKNKAILFLACGLREPEIQLMLRRDKIRRERYAERGIPSPPRFFLKSAYFTSEASSSSQIRDREREQCEINRLAEFDIQIVWYDKVDDEHSGLLEILEYWSPPPGINFYRPEEEAWYQE